MFTQELHDKCTSSFIQANLNLILSNHADALRFCHESLGTILEKVDEMDKQIRNIEKTIKKDSKKEEKKLGKLEQADKKRDKTCEYGAKMMKKKKK